LNIHLHCLVLDGVYRRTEGEPIFDEARAPTGDELEGLLDKIVARLMKMLTRSGHLVEEQGMTYLADTDADHPLASLQAASCTYRIALGPRAGQKVLSLRTGGGRDEKTKRALCAAAHGFSLHAGVRCGADQRKQLERLCRYISRPALANERLERDGEGRVVLQLKSAWRDGTTHIGISALKFMQRLAATVPRCSEDARARPAFAQRAGIALKCAASGRRQTANMIERAASNLRLRVCGVRDTVTIREKGGLNLCADTGCPGRVPGRGCAPGLTFTIGG
jgi:hypothetical protein